MKTLEQILDGVTAGGQWRVVNRPSRGLQIEWGPEGGEIERPVMHMRWTDGLNSHVEAAVAADAAYAARAARNFPALVKALQDLVTPDETPLNEFMGKIRDAKAVLTEALKD